MEYKTRYALKHKTEGHYWGDRGEPTFKLWHVRRFIDHQQIEIYLGSSIYKPDKPDMYKIVPLEMGIREVEEDERNAEPLSKN